MTRSVVVPGLAPSTGLAPSPVLPPAVTVYSGGPISPHAIAMGVGAGGSLVDVSAWVEFGEQITYRYGRATQFDDVQPGTFTFTLNNRDGRFTPENPASPLSTTVMEGMSVCWQLGSRLIHGTVLSAEIPADEATWHHLVVTCDDMLGAASRHMLTSLADGLVDHQQDDLMWRLDEGPDAVVGVETHMDTLGGFTLHSSNPSSTTAAVVFGEQQATGLPGTAVTVTAAPGETNWFGTRFGNSMVVSGIKTAVPVSGQSLAYGFWNMWVYPASTINLAVTPFFAVGPSYSYSMQIQCTPTTIGVRGGTAAAVTYTMTAAEQLLPHYVSMYTRLIWQPSSSSWYLYLDLYIDTRRVTGTYWYDPVHQYTIPVSLTAMSPVVVNVSVTNPAGATGNLSGTVQRISHTNRGAGLEVNALYNTLDQRRAVLDFIADEVSSATYNGPLSAAPIGFPDVNDTTILDVYNDIARSEAGHIFTLTTGSLLNPVEQIQVRARDRPSVPEAVFDVTTEGSGLPSFVRDITNVAASLQVTGPTGDAMVTDPTITGRYVTSGTSETVLYTGQEDLTEWGQDRLQRGKNRSIRAQTFAVDAVTTPTDRTADLLALVPGDRLQLKNTPAASLGFATWDGWVLGGVETHGYDINRFEFNLSPVLPTAAVADTDRFASGGDATLGSTYTATATSIVIQTLYGTGISTDVPYTIQVEAEQMTVTAVSGITATVTRGVNGTTAAPHAVNTAVEVAPAAVYAY